MSGDPSDIRSTPVYIAFFILEYVLEGVGSVDHVSSMRMNHSFRLSSGTGSVEDEEHVF